MITKTNILGNEVLCHILDQYRIKFECNFILYNSNYNVFNIWNFYITKLHKIGNIYVQN